jgi:hypothetical protein
LKLQIQLLGAMKSESGFLMSMPQFYGMQI